MSIKLVFNRVLVTQLGFPSSSLIWFSSICWCCCCWWFCVIVGADVVCLDRLN